MPHRVAALSPPTSPDAWAQLDPGIGLGGAVNVQIADVLVALQREAPDGLAVFDTARRFVYLNAVAGGVGGLNLRTI